MTQDGSSTDFSTDTSGNSLTDYTNALNSLGGTAANILGAVNKPPPTSPKTGAPGSPTVTPPPGGSALSGNTVYYIAGGVVLLIVVLILARK